jgi:hypothetical protein
MSAPQPHPDGEPRVSVGSPTSHARFIRTLVRVLSVQAVTLILLWLLQARYHG